MSGRFWCPKFVDESHEKQVDIVAKRLGGSTAIEEVVAPERKTVIVSVKEHRKISRGSYDYEKKHKRDSKVGEIGERLVLEHERNLLKAQGIENIEDVVFLTSENREYGNSYPCDIISYNPENGEKIFIEVKTTTENSTTPFYISAKEVDFSKENANNYKLYRVYDVLNETENPKFYITKGDVEENYTLVGDAYIAYREIIHKR